MESVEQATSINIAILPSSGVSELAIALSQKVGQNFPTEFTLNHERYMPHVTIYQAHFPLKNIPLLVNELKGITSATEPFRINMEEFTISYDTFIFWICERSQALQSLHEEVVGRTNPLREGSILPHLTQVTGLTEDDKIDMQRYGALGIGPGFRPHLTISRFSDFNDANAAINSLKEVNNKAIFEVKELILGYLGQSGTVNGVIETFKLRE